MKRELIWGTMRMLEHSEDPSFWSAFLSKIHESGITSLHSSIEYESFPLLCEVLRRMKKEGREFNHVVKLAEPSFDDLDVSADRLASKVDTYRRMLGCDTVHGVQWMWRQSLKDDPSRISKYTERSGEIAKSFMALREQQKLTRVFCFPYSTKFAQSWLAQTEHMGLALYWNSEEQGQANLLDACAQSERPVIAIRPFAAGKTSKTTKESLDFAFSKASVSGVVLTATKDDHLNPVLEYAQTL